MSNHNLCLSRNMKKMSEFLSENFHFLVVKFSVYLNRHIFVMTVSFVTQEFSATETENNSTDLRLFYHLANNKINLQVQKLHFACITHAKHATCS